MTHCIDLKLNINPLRNGIHINSYGTNRHTKISHNDISSEFINLITELKLKIVLVELFYSKPNSRYDIHIDVTGGDYTKLNYVYGGSNSTMNWYKPKYDIAKSVDITSINTSCIKYKYHEVELIEQSQVKFPSIIQAGIPHNVTNYHEPRYCLSIILVNEDNSRLTMAESLLVFSKFLE